MRNETARPRTLKQLNVFAYENEDDFRVDKLLDGIFFGLKDYEEYLKSAKKLIQEQNAIEINVQLEKQQKESQKQDERKNKIWRYNLDSLEKLSEKKSDKIKKILFKDEVDTVYASKPTGDYRIDKNNEIRIDNRNESELYIEFEQDPGIDKKIFLKANDHQIKKQQEALRILKDTPEQFHSPLIRLFDKPQKSQEYFRENINRNSENAIEFKILNKLDIDGTQEQQAFVEKALNTKDFALLEGPPGSGKTTAIIELIIQSVLRGERVLLVSSTHVAVDNVIDRIVEKYKDVTDGIISPMRIARDKNLITKENVERYRMQEFVSQIKRQMISNLESQKKSKGRKALMDSLRSNDKNSNFDDIILNSANLVGGTTIGILQHPMIKSGNIKPFDLMIVDEASKVTFLDFLVPALHAKKWVLVGDVNQLSPFTDNEIISDRLDSIIKKEGIDPEIICESNEILKKLTLNPQDKSIQVLYTNKDKKQYDYLKAREFEVFHLSKQNLSSEECLLLNSADIIVAKPSPENKKTLETQLKFKAKFYAEKFNESDSLSHLQNFYHKKNNSKTPHNYRIENSNEQTWGQLVGNQLEQIYQYRFAPKLKEYKKEELNLLVPSEIQSEVEGIRRVALPSILELLQIGVGVKKNLKEKPIDKILYYGFNDMSNISDLKFQSLSYQHRMLDIIAEKPKKYFYENKNLITANTVSDRVNPLEKYKKDEEAIVWVPNNQPNSRKRIVNQTEVKQIKDELVAFKEFASNQNKEHAYEVAVLTFYKDQESELRQMLRRLTKSYGKNRHFRLNNIKITLCTVDKFQGDEADMVLLSFTKATKYAFYNSPNRLNVAITRARHKLILYGNPDRLEKKAGLYALHEIAKNTKKRLTSYQK